MLFYVIIFDVVLNFLRAVFFKSNNSKDSEAIDRVTFVWMENEFRTCLSNVAQTFSGLYDRSS